MKTKQERMFPCTLQWYAKNTSTLPQTHLGADGNFCCWLNGFHDTRLNPLPLGRKAALLMRGTKHRQQQEQETEHAGGLQVRGTNNK